MGTIKLSLLPTGQRGRIISVQGQGAFRKRILEMGFIQGKEVEVVLNAPLKDPVYYKVMGYNVSLRRKDAELIEVEPIDGEHLRQPLQQEEDRLYWEERANSEVLQHNKATPPTHKKSSLHSKANPQKKIRVALVGNPNSGKTSIFNLASGRHERVGNYSGVTIDAHSAHLSFQDYYIELIDLPGSYSLSPYSPEELYIRNYLTDPATRPDVVVDIVDSTNLERNLYLTVQLIEMGVPLVVALNMYDEFRKREDRLNISLLSKLFDVAFIPTVGRVAEGIEDLFQAVVSRYEQGQRDDAKRRDIRVNYGSILEPHIEELTSKIESVLPEERRFPARYLAVHLLEGDQKVEEQVATLPKGEYILSATRYHLAEVAKGLGNTTAETAITDHRYGFIAGALRETYRPKRSQTKTLTDRIDAILLHRVWGVVLFVFFLYLMFQATFTLGAYPQAWIEQLVDWFGGLLASSLPEGVFADLLIDGIVAGVGGVIVFLPQIVILYFFISLMEDTGYMARATFIMDRAMHAMGLHGKSFIPLIMGFGCNVPAIMATRTIESRQSRLITMLINPLMSCSARLPVYILLAGAFFPRHAGLVLFSLYGLGILLSVGLAWLFRKALFKKEDLPFVMELPPYRVPTSRSVVIHMWDRSKMYLKKMGSVILVASIIIWLLGYFPRKEVMQQAEVQLALVEKDLSLNSHEREERIKEIVLQRNSEQQRTSYLGQIGRGLEPIMSPLGFDWKMSIAIASGLPAKEVVVSTLGVIYTGDSDDSEEATIRLSEKLRSDTDEMGNPTFTPLIAYTFMVFVLIYFPCIATIAAIGRESGSWLWALFVVVYTCLLAWGVSFLVYRVGLLLGF